MEPCTDTSLIVECYKNVFVCVDDDEEGPTSVDQEGEEDDDKEKERKVEEAEEMEEEGGEELDPLDAYMEEVKEEVKKFNMGTMRGGNDKVRHKLTLI